MRKKGTIFVIFSIFHLFIGSIVMVQSLPVEITHYKGVYTFKDDASGNIPTDFAVTTTFGHNYIIDYENSHAKVFEQFDTGNGNYNQVFVDILDGEGNIEFYLSVSSTENSGYFGIYENDFQIMTCGINFGQLRIRSSTDHTSALTDSWHGSFSANIWYKFRLNYNSNSDSIQIYVDDVDFGEFNVFYADQITHFRLATGMDQDYQTYSWWDSISYDWSPSYNLGEITEIDLIETISSTITSTSTTTIPPTTNPSTTTTPSTTSSSATSSTGASTDDEQQGALFLSQLGQNPVGIILIVGFGIVILVSINKRSTKKKRIQIENQNNQPQITRNQINVSNASKTNVSYFIDELDKNFSDWDNKIDNQDGKKIGH